MNLMGVVNDRSYGIVCYNLLKELKCKFWPIHPTQAELDYDYSLIQECEQKEYINDTSVRVWHQFDLAQHVCSNRVGFPIFELDNFNKNELEQMRAQDSLIVCSKWAQSVLEGFNLPSKVVPLGVSSIFQDNYSPGQDTYKFVCIGKWEIRKGHDFLVKCFNAAFSQSDRVELYLSCHNPFLSPMEVSQWEGIYKKSSLGNKIKFLPWYKTQTELAQNLKKMDCGVFLSRAEGWNLEALELMAMGRPVILTNYSGHTEFATPDNSYLVDYTDKELAVDGKWFFGQGEWMKLGEKQFEQTVEYMRFVYKNRPKNTAGAETGKQFTWENSANTLRGLYGI